MRRLLARLAAYIVIPLTIVTVLVRVLLAEENRPDPRDFPRYGPPADLVPSNKEYVEWASDHTARVIRSARIRSIRSTTVALVSGFSALAIMFAVAVRAPNWVPAVLGFIAASGQYLQGLSRDRELAHLDHQQAVRFQRLLRDFHTDIDEIPAAARHRRFKEFRESFEKIKAEYGSEMFKISGQEPPQIGE